MFAGHKSEAMDLEESPETGAIPSHLVAGTTSTLASFEAPMTASQKDSDGKTRLLNKSTIVTGKFVVAMGKRSVVWPSQKNASVSSVSN